jgi:acyl-CoA reductase-like NAD-dependent aldehyde dehydrogenase
MDNYNPSNGKVYGKLPESDADDVDLAVKSCLKAFPSWSKTTRQDRSKILNKIADIVESKLEDFAAAESRDQGKPVSLARTVDIPRVVANFRYFAGNYPY